MGCRKLSRLRVRPLFGHFFRAFYNLMTLEKLRVTYVLLFSVIQQFSGATVIRGYVVKMFGSIFNSSARLADRAARCECDCGGGAAGPQVPQSAYFSAIIIGREAIGKHNAIKEL